MKADELMPGDWVRMSRCERVEAVPVTSGDGYEPEPVPLTKEIMDANLAGDDGWRLDGLRYVWRNTFTAGGHLNAVTVEFVMDQALLCVYERKSDMSHSQEPRILGLRIDHVHELQHALRLCGLNCLANNFKIK